ncbi:MAG: hypothetical protein WBE18_08345 [Gammaproteobacteria bacterium]
MQKQEQYTTWWGTFQFEKDQACYWQLGSCLLSIVRTIEEWQIASTYADELADQPAQIAVPKLSYHSKHSPIFKHFGFAATTSEITLLPVLASRNQVSRPEFPFYVPAGQKVILYISSPAWVCVSLGQSKQILHEIPTQLQSDTWFGSNTRRGELCYASHTRCRRQFDPALLQPHRIISTVTIINNASQNLLIERLKLPLPYLSVYCCQQGYLWTEDLTMEHKTSSRGAIVHIEKGLPHMAQQPQQISKPRLLPKSGGIIDMITEFL